MDVFVCESRRGHEGVVVCGHMFPDSAHPCEAEMRARRAGCLPVFLPRTRLRALALWLVH